MSLCKKILYRNIYLIDNALQYGVIVCMALNVASQMEFQSIVNDF